MTGKNTLWAIIEAVIWYLFFYYLLYAVKTDVGLGQSALILLILAYVGTVTCPWLRQTEAWRKLTGKH